MTPSPASPERKIRVLLLTDELEMGGTQRQIVHLACAMDRERFEPTVAYFRNRSVLADELERAGVPVVELSKRGRLDPWFVRRLVAFLGQGRFDVMHCFAFSGELWGTIGRRVLAPAQRPVLVTSVRGVYDWYSALQWRLKRWAALQSRCIVANSRAGGDYACSMMGLEPGAIEVVYNGVADAPHFASLPPDSRARGTPVTALFVGRLVEIKNVFVLLEAMKRLRTEGHSLHLRIVGEGPLRDEIAARIAADGLSGKVEMMGERRDAIDLIAASDFLVLPSLREGMSNVILESMIVGRPVIASAVGGSLELVEPSRTGLLFPSGDDAALAEAMRKLADDANLRESFGAAARRRALEAFTIGAMVQAMQELYARCAIERVSARAAA